MVLQMQLREAMKIVGGLTLSSDQSVRVVSSYEPLHFWTFLQAQLAIRFPRATPVARGFGFDQMERGLQATENELVLEPAITLLEWSDFHPSLSWTARTDNQFLSSDEWRLSSGRAVQRLAAWLSRRSPDSSVVVLPSDGWFPLADPSQPLAFGASLVRAHEAMWQLALIALEHGAGVVRATGDVDLRSLAVAGCPMTVDAGSIVADTCVELLFPIQRRKVLVVDLDNTLWHGVLAEDGLPAIQCGESGVGVPFLMFQKFLRKLRSEGILLAYCSKNEQSDVDEALRSDRVWLVPQDFATGVAGWRSKSTGLGEIADRLGLGLDSFVFVDDNPAEIAEVQANTQDVLCIQTPSETRDWPAFLRSIQGHFSTPRISEADQIRTSSAEVHRREYMQGKDSNPSEYGHLRDLELRVQIQTNAASEVRVSELLNKTNQFNLTGQRVNSADLLNWSKDATFFCASIGLRDRHGPYGTIGAMYGWRRADGSTEVDNMVLSCRALGRGVEYLALHAVHLAVGGDQFVLNFQHTPRNEPARRFLASVIGDPDCLDGSTKGEIRALLDSSLLSRSVQMILEETGAVIDDV
jgi:FkbH-like protein